MEDRAPHPIDDEGPHGKTDDRKDRGHDSAD
jgi:hypothetical protein